MKKCLAIVVCGLIITLACGCQINAHQEAAQAPPDAHQVLGEHVKASLKDSLMTGWQLSTVEECPVPPGWINSSAKGWHVVVVSPETEAGALNCHFWVFPADWKGVKRPLPLGTEIATAFYYCQSDELMLFTQPPMDPDMTQIAVSQIAQALGVPDARGELSSQTDARKREIHNLLLAAAGKDRDIVQKMVDRDPWESKYAMTLNVGNCSNDQMTILVNALRKTFPEKRTFIIHRVGSDYQDSIIVGGKP
jgi:hypothetical protein